MIEPEELMLNSQFDLLMDKWDLEWDVDFAETVDDKDGSPWDFDKPSYILQTSGDVENGILGYRLFVYNPHKDHELLMGPEFDIFLDHYEETGAEERSQDLEIMAYLIRQAAKNVV